MNKPPVLSIVIPLYKAEKHVLPLLEALINWNNEVSKSIFQCQLILVDDGSNDKGLEIASEFLTSFSMEFSLLRLTQNCGQHTALSAGIHFSQSDWIATMDDDLQHWPEHLMDLWHTAQTKSLDLIYGYHEHSKHDPWRNLASTMVRTITKTFFYDYSKVTSFRLFRAEIASTFRESLSTSFLIDTELLTQAKRVEYIPVPHQRRINATSRYNFYRLLRMSIKVWSWHSVLRTIPWIRRKLNPPFPCTVEWFGGSTVFESFRLKKEHIQWVRGWRNSEFVNREMDFRAFITAEQQEIWFSNLNPNTDFYFIHRYRGEWVGVSHVLIPSSTVNGNSEASVVGENGGFVNDERWKGSGISLAIAIHTLDYAFYELGVSVLRIKVNKHNKAALGLNATLGYRKTCSLTDEFDQFELPIGEYEHVSPRLRKLLKFL